MSDLNLEITELKPALISGPLLSHYLGRVVLELPDILNFSYLSVRFSLQGSGERLGRITFHENGGAPGHDGPPLELEVLFRQLTEIKNLLGEAREAGEYQLEEFGRPARLIIHLTRNSVLDDIRADLDLPPAPRKLELDLAIEQDWGFLEFSYEEICSGNGEELARQTEEAKAGLISWVQDFLPYYQWQGVNQAPPPGALATRFGFIKPLENRPDMAGDYYASFEMPRDDDEKSTLDFLTFTVKTSAAANTEIRAGNRRVGGHQGYESRKLSRLDESSDPNPLPGKELVLYLEWQDLSEAKQVSSEATYDAALYASVTREELDDLSYYLGLWNALLDSVQGLDQTAVSESGPPDETAEDLTEGFKSAPETISAGDDAEDEADAESPKAGGANGPQ